MKKIYIKYFLLIIYLCMLILVVNLSLENGTKSKKTSTFVSHGIVNTITPPNDNTTVTKQDEGSIETKTFNDLMLLKLRKIIGHFGYFFLLGIVGSIVFFLFIKFNNIYKNIFYTLFFSIIIAYLFSFLTEFIQYFVDGRVMSYKDVLLNVLGSTIGAIIPIYLISFWKSWNTCQN